MEYTFGESSLPDFAVRSLALSMIERPANGLIELGALSVVNASSALWCACIDAVDRCTDFESSVRRNIYCSYLPLDDFLRPETRIEDGLLIVAVDQKSTDRFGRVLFEKIRNLQSREFLHVIPAFESEPLMEAFLEYCFPAIPVCLLGNPTPDDLDILIAVLLLRSTRQIMELDLNACAVT